MQTLHISTEHKRQVIDITDQVAATLPDDEGMLSVFVQHTTAALTIMDLDPGTDDDFLDFLNSLVPNIDWRHPHDPAHAPDHLLASLVGPSAVVPYIKGRLQLGSWQRLVLVEFDGPRELSVIISSK
ncbi:MAG TPA: secondary thiamine-phosphate synthase enzyme YjbQ [Candidatus Saccharimonadales bacterium]|nr:secondary thiamine-phosphate synthase enzyme YjbQ [Candidatus Saccharimonadales bacterium]